MKSPNSQDADRSQSEIRRLLNERKPALDALSDEAAVFDRFNVLQSKWLKDARSIIDLLLQGNLPADMFEFGADYGELYLLLHRLPQGDPTVIANLAVCEELYNRTMRLLELKGSVPVCTDCVEAYKVLGLTAGASSSSEIKDAHRDLAKVWHPDRFSREDHRLTSRAHEEFKKVQSAFEHLTEHGTKSDSNARPDLNVTEPNVAPPVAPPEPIIAETEAKPTQTVYSTESSAWRYGKVSLRTIWRLATLLASTVLALFMVILLLLSLFMFLYQYWEGESKRATRSGGGFESERFFAFVNSVTWLPQQAWHGLMFFVSIVFIAAVLFGSSIWNVASAHMPAVASLICIAGLATAGWVFRKEWHSEFLHFPNAPTVNSWVMGLVVLVAGTGALCWSYESGVFGRYGTPDETRTNQVVSANPNQSQTPAIAPVAIVQAPATHDSSVQSSFPAVDNLSLSTPVAPSEEDNSVSGSDDVAGPSDSQSPSQESVEEAVTRWGNAFRERNVIALADCYAPMVERYFLRNNVEKNQLYRWVESAFNRIADIREYQLNDIRTEVLPPDQNSTDSSQFTRATATFNKKWATLQTDGKVFSGEEIERLTFSSSSDGWKIVREEELEIINASRK